MQHGGMGGQQQHMMTNPMMRPRGAAGMAQAGGGLRQVRRPAALVRHCCLKQHVALAADLAAPAAVGDSVPAEADGTWWHDEAPDGPAEAHATANGAAAATKRPDAEGTLGIIIHNLINWRADEIICFVHVLVHTEFQSRKAHAVYVYRVSPDGAFIDLDTVTQDTRHFCNNLLHKMFTIVYSVVT